MSLETVQRRSTKYILQNYSSIIISRDSCLWNFFLSCTGTNFKISCLSSSASKPIMIILTYTNTFLLIVTCSSYTFCIRSQTEAKPLPYFSLYILYFNRILKLWNAFPDLMTSIKTFLTAHHWNHFITHFNPACTFHFVCPFNNCYTFNVCH